MQANPALHPEIIHNTYMASGNSIIALGLTNLVRGTANGTYHSVLTKIITRMGNRTNVTHSGYSPRTVISFVLQSELYSSAEDENMILAMLCILITFFCY